VTTKPCLLVTDPGVIISASRRTDIPQYYARWFAERRKVGLAEFRTAFGTAGRVSLLRDDVLGYLFWTKNAAPFHDQLAGLRAEGIPYAFQYTVNGYGPPLEAHIPALSFVLADFLRVVRGLPDPRCAQWRYDPIVIADGFDLRYHLRRFCEIAAALAGATRVVNTSIVEPYVKTIRRVGAVVPTAQYRKLDPVRNPTAARRHPDLRQVGHEAAGRLVTELRGIAAEHGMELRTCCNPELALSPAQCCGAELFAGYGPVLEGRAARLASGPSRASCRCLKSVDIGMDNTCLGGCRYCYVVTSHELAVSNFRRHQPAGPSLR